MASYSFLSDATSVQTTAAFAAIVERFGGNGKWYSLGDDVNALFFKPNESANQKSDTSSVEPSVAWACFSDYLALSGKKMHPVVNQCAETFAGLLQERSVALEGSWFNIPGESSAEAFLRRLKKDDITYSVYAEYVAELKEKWASALEVSQSTVADKIATTIEPQYENDVANYERTILYGSENSETKVAADTIAKDVASGDLAARIGSSEIIVASNSGTALNADDLQQFAGSEN